MLDVLLTQGWCWLDDSDAQRMCARLYDNAALKECSLTVPPLACGEHHAVALGNPLDRAILCHRRSRRRGAGAKHVAGGGQRHVASHLYRSAAKRGLAVGCAWGPPSASGAARHPRAVGADARDDRIRFYADSHRPAVAVDLLAVGRSQASADAGDPCPQNSAAVDRGSAVRRPVARSPGVGAPVRVHPVRAGGVLVPRPPAAGCRQCRRPHVAHVATDHVARPERCAVEPAGHAASRLRRGGGRNPDATTGCATGWFRT